MDLSRKLFWAALALSILLFGGCAGQEGDQTPESRPDPEMTSGTSSSELSAQRISFEGTDMEGNTVSSDIFSQSRLTMLNVWATYCGPCLNEMPSLGELAAEYDLGDLQIIGIISDVMEGEDQTLAESLIQQTGADYPHLLLNESIYYAFLTDVTAVPTTFFLDQDGTPLGYVVGAREKAVWKEIIDGLLEGS